jgi:DNA-binding NarL/FixJ family response regulator
MPTILIADDHPLFRDALRGAVARALPGAVLLEAESVSSLLALAEAHPETDLLLLDLNMPGAQGFSALVHLRATFPSLPVIVVSAHEDPGIVRRAIGHDAAGYIPKSSSLEIIVEALGAVLDGNTWLPAGLDLEAVDLDRDEADLARRVSELTPQQFRVLGMLCTGLLNKQIAWELGVSEATVKAHMTAILRKLGASNRMQAVLLAGRLNIVEQGC